MLRAYKSETMDEVFEVYGRAARNYCSPLARLAKK
jgi:hypothetical protein